MRCRRRRDRRGMVYRRRRWRRRGVNRCGVRRLLRGWNRGGFFGGFSTLSWCVCRRRSLCRGNSFRRCCGGGIGDRNRLKLSRMCSSFPSSPLVSVWMNNKCYNNNNSVLIIDLFMLRANTNITTKIKRVIYLYIEYSFCYGDSKR